MHCESRPIFVFRNYIQVWVSNFLLKVSTKSFSNFIKEAEEEPNTKVFTKPSSFTVIWNFSSYHLKLRISIIGYLLYLNKYLHLTFFTELCRFYLMIFLLSKDLVSSFWKTKYNSPEKQRKNEWNMRVKPLSFYFCVSFWIIFPIIHTMAIISHG